MFHVLAVMMMMMMMMMMMIMNLVFRDKKPLYVKCKTF
jgi:hypothetical protein